MAAPTKLIDISHHQDWPHSSLIKALDGIILRCAYGLGTADRKFLQFVAEAKATGLPWAAYHFIKPGSGTQQAEFAMRRLDAAGGCPVLFMDREWERGAIASEATADAYINRVKQAGLTTGTYMSLSGYQNHGADIDWPAFWTRLVNPILPPIYHAGDFLQHAGDDNPTGNKIDRDIYNGTPAQLRALFTSGNAGQVPHTPPIVAVPPADQPGSTGDVMFNLIPGVAKRTVILRPGSIFYDRAVGGTRYSRVPEDAPETQREFAWIGGANDKRIWVADGDYAVTANRADVERQTSNEKAFGR